MYIDKKKPAIDMIYIGKLLDSVKNADTKDNNNNNVKE
jgi:hypothetical protein